MRLIVVGDIHGCIAEFDELLHKLHFQPGQDRLVLLGDLVDRGPDSAGVVRLAMSAGAECVLGNHEEKHLRWRRHAMTEIATGKKNPMRQPSRAFLDIQASIDPMGWAYLEAMPIEIPLLPGWVAVHAGFEPGRPRNAQKPAAVLRVRWVDSQGKMVALDPEGPMTQPQGTVPWTTLWAGESVVYGHNVWGLDQPREDRSLSGATCIGLDTGCCFGGKLTAMVWDSQTAAVPFYVQVSARSVYAKLRSSEDA